MVNEIQFFNEGTLPKNCSIFGQIGLQIGWFFSQFLAAAFLARNVSQNHFSFSQEMREMCISSFHPHLERMLPNKYHVTQLASTFSLCGVAPYLETLAMDTSMFIIQKRVEY